jgi:hypothetical protein
VGNTLFIGRKPKKAKSASQEGSYGRSIEEYFTAEDPALEDGQGHHRVLRYDFDGLDMVVRIEADAYVPDLEYKPDAPVVLQPLHDSTTTSATSIFHHTPRPTIVIPKGTIVPHAQIVEMKSNDKTKPKEQMWFVRTPLCCLGAHKNGLFTRADVEMFDQDEVEEWENKYQIGLRKLVWLLHELRTVVKDRTREGTAVLVATGKGKPIVVYETKTRVGALPQEIVERFWEPTYM